ncbi:MAG: SDR family NAD(P)-dependent oxidoreductase [Chloroflexi bacterium]|nr:SDR family NAD(P)-dependent oxidoreductase [Chloroflexota bacterium]MDL1942582.1 SDR family oxidoreductase [Chloroflexi bacterium CFX2]
MTHPSTQAILVTGASSGIGKHLTLRLAGRGHPVYATVRKEADVEALSKIENVIPLLMDVRNAEQVRAAFEKVSESGRGLYGLVNNAGVGDLGMLVTWTDEEMYDIFNVNVFGPHRVTNAFIQLLVEAKGRVVNIGSQGGMLTSKYYGPYIMTKHALEAYTAVLYDELKPYGVQVSVIQPGGIVSDIGNNMMAGTIAHFQRAQPPFKAEAEMVLQSFTEESEPNPNEPESATNRKPSSPEIVWDAVRDALFSEKPKMRYLVGTHWEGNRVINALISKLLDENDNPMHNYSRDELIALLDKHLEARSIPQQ